MKVFAAIMAVLATACVPIGQAADFNGDGTDDICVFRPSQAMWAIRGQGKIYHGTAWSDDPIPGDYNGDGTDQVAIYRATNTMFAIRNQGKIYYGTPGDIPLAGAGGGAL